MQDLPRRALERLVVALMSDEGVEDIPPERKESLRNDAVTLGLHFVHQFDRFFEDVHAIAQRHGHHDDEERQP
jgi:hypothetical protein